MNSNNINFLLVILCALIVPNLALLELKVDKDYQIHYRVGKRLKRVTGDNEKEGPWEQDYFIEAGVTIKKLSDGWLKCNMTGFEAKGFVMDEDLSKPFMGNVSSNGELDTLVDEGKSKVSSDIKRHMLSEFLKDRSEITQLLRNKTVGNDFRLHLPLGLCKPKIDVVRREGSVAVRVEARASDCKGEPVAKDTTDKSATRVEIHYKKDNFLALLVVTELSIIHEKQGYEMKGVEYERFINYDEELM